MDSESSIQEEQKEQRRSGKEAYEARKREKEALKQSKHKEQKRSRSGKQFAVFAAIVLVIAAAGYGFFLFARNTVPQTEDLIIPYNTDDGKIVKETFNLVVLSVGLTVSEGIRQLARKLGITLDECGFTEASAFSPVVPFPGKSEPCACG